MLRSLSSLVHAKKARQSLGKGFTFTNGIVVVKSLFNGKKGASIRTKMHSQKKILFQISPLLKDELSGGALISYRMHDSIA